MTARTSLPPLLFLVWMISVSTSALHGEDVYVDDFGASGDGVTIDDVAFRNAIQAAGVDGRVILGTGRIYNLSRSLAPLSGQTIEGNGATIRRANELLTTLTVGAQAGDTTITVADPSAYEVGMVLTPVRASGSQNDGEFTGNHSIRSINGNQITLNKALSQDYEAGSNVVNVFNQIHYVGRPGVLTLDDVKLDGNRSNNDTYLSWARNRAVHGKDNLVIRNSIFHDLPGDAIGAYGTNHLIENNLFQDGNTSGIHLSGNYDETDVMIRGNVFRGLNEQAERAGHSEGAITISRDSNHVRVIDNVALDGQESFIASFHTDMSDWTIRENQVYDFNRLFLGNSRTGEPLQGLEWIDNYALNVGNSELERTNNGIYIEDLVFTGNTIVDGTIRLEGLENSFVTSNEIHSSGGNPLDVTDTINTIVSENDLYDDYINFDSDNSRLIYNRVTGDVSLFSDDRINRFLLATDGDLAFDINAYLGPFEGEENWFLGLPFLLAHHDDSVSGFKGRVELGAILPSGLGEESLAESLLVHRHSSANRSYGNFDLTVVPEPDTRPLMMVVAIVIFLSLLGRKIRGLSRPESTQA